MEKQVKVKSYLPKKERVFGGISFTLTHRDLEILQAVNRYRYLRSGQIKRLIFPENGTIQSAHRRLKFLFHNHYLGRIQPLIRPGQGSAETAYYLAKKGLELLEAEGEEVLYYGQSKDLGHHYLNHSLEVSEFRIHLELAGQNHSLLRIAKFINEFELKSHTQNSKGKEAFKLFKKLRHPITYKEYSVHPDGLFIFQGKGEHEKHQKLYYMEVDRGTETLGRIRDKLTGYQLYFQEKVFAQFGEFSGFTVLLQTDSSKRADNIRQELKGLSGTELVWVTDDKKVNEKTILHGPIWLDHELKLRSIVKAREKEKI